MSDTDFPFDPDDPRVTAYALDEMHDAAARAGFEQILARSPEARAMVEEIRALSGQLVAEYDEERRLAQAEPSNVIPLPMAAPRRASAWAGHLLRMAAMLAVLGIAAVLLAPYIRTPQAVKLHSEGESSLAVEARVLPASPTVPAFALAPPAATDGRREPGMVARSGVATQMAIPAPGALNAPDSSFTLGSINGQTPRTAPANARELGVNTAKAGIITRPAAPSSFAKDAKDGSGTLAAPAGREESDVAALPPSLAPAFKRNMQQSLAAIAPAQPEVPATVTGNALGGGAGAGGGGAGGGGAAPAATAKASDAVAEDAFFQNRFENGGRADGNGADQFSLSDSKRLMAPSQSRVPGALESEDDAGFVSPAGAPISTFAIAWNNSARKKSLESESRKIDLAEPAVAGKMLSDFPFSDAPPASGDPHALAVHAESASCPWAPDHRLVRIGIKGRSSPAANSEKAGAGAQIQVKFNPATVAAYRLLGGSQREIQLNAWQEATVLYEVVPAKAVEQDKAKEMAFDRLPVDRPAIAQAAPEERAARLRLLGVGGLLTVAVQPAVAGESGSVLTLGDVPLTVAQGDEVTTLNDHADISKASADLKFAAAVAAFDLASKAPRSKGAPSLDLAAELAHEGLGNDPGGYRASFLKTIRKAQTDR